MPLCCAAVQARPSGRVRRGPANAHFVPRPAARGGAGSEIGTRLPVATRRKRRAEDRLAAETGVNARTKICKQPPRNSRPRAEAAGLGSDKGRSQPHRSVQSWSAVGCHRFGHAEQAGHPSHPFSEARVLDAAKAAASHRTPRSVFGCAPGALRSEVPVVCHCFEPHARITPRAGVSERLGCSL